MLTEKSLPVPRFALTPLDPTLRGVAPIFKGLRINSKLHGTGPNCFGGGPAMSVALHMRCADVGSRNLARSRQ